MKPEALFSLTYGMYAIGVTDGTKPSACIVNTVVQASTRPAALLVSMSHENYSHTCIEKTGLFTVSVLSEDTSGAVIGVLGFSTGKTGDKLANVRYKMLREGVPVIKENSCCWFLCKVIGRMETETHTVFLGQILAGSDRVEGTPMTYAYYQRVIKGTPSKNAPTYRLPGPDRAGNDGEAFLCQICKYEYNDPITPFAELPDDWVCPVCGSSQSVFARNRIQ